MLIFLRQFIACVSLVWFVLLCTVGCGKRGAIESGSTAADTSQAKAADVMGPKLSPIGKAAPSSGTTLFETLEAADCGIDFVPEWKPRNHAEALLLKTGFTGGGVCIGDYNDDGLPDVYLTRSHGGGRLYRNLGDFKFEDVTQAAQVQRDDDWPTGAAFCDVNNDGRLDLVVACLKTANRLFLNQGNGTFKDVSSSSGFDFAGASIKPIFADYDGDGDLDAYLVTNRLEPESPVKIEYTGSKGSYGVAEKHQELAMVINLPSGEQKFAKAGQFDRLYRNDLSTDGKVKFTDVTKEAGLTGNFHGLDACWWDADNDGDADLYVTNDFTDPDQFYRNNGDGTFTDVTKESLPCTPWFAMGCDAGDLNNDGRLDLLAADMAGTSHYRQKMAMGSMDAVAWFLDTAEPRQYMRNSLFVNTGTPRFQEAAQLAGLASSDWTWSVKIADFDNDGREDVFFTNGFTRDYLNSDFNNKLKRKEPGKKPLAWYDAPRLEEQNHVFRNEGQLHFAETSEAWGLDHVGISFGAAVADLDGDGDLDIVVNNFESAPSLYRNGSAASNRCKVKLVGNASNRQAIGASVQIKTATGTQLRYHNPSGGYLSCDESVIHFGLGDMADIEELLVRWPSGLSQTIKNVAANQLITIVEEGGVSEETPTSQPLFSETDWLSHASHSETPFNDFAKQPLLPNKLSQLGPGMAVGDVNGDGLADVFLSGASEKMGQLFMQVNSGEFKSVELACLEAHRASEDMGCLLLDVDGDDDLDLFIVSGGVESEANSVAYRDRLYINVSADGAVKFEHASNAIPDLRDSGGSVSAADFDQDGDLDLFVGGRVVPGQYPTEPKSRLLRNDGGTFVAVADAISAELGMVTSTLWSDVDNDGWLDLLVTNDYGPIRVLLNDNGNFKEASAELQTAKLLGWWNSIMGCDVDLDGDTDYIVGNLGTNTKYHPTEKKPQLLFFGSFDGEGSENRIVEAKSSADGLLPTRGRSCSCNAMPFLEKKFETFHGFASASLNEIYSDSLLQKAKRVRSTMAESGVLINSVSPEGQRVFEFRPLPVDAQMSPVFGVDVIHANDDAYPDLFLAQNFYTPQRETGRMAGGVSCVLLGKGDGSFVSMRPDESGIVIPEDAKSAVAGDLNGDGRPDVIVATNDGEVRTFTMRADRANEKVDDKTRGKTEKYLGAGYLSSGSL